MSGVGMGEQNRKLTVSLYILAVIPEISRSPRGAGCQETMALRRGGPNLEAPELFYLTSKLTYERQGGFEAYGR